MASPPGDAVPVARRLARRLIYNVPGECERCPACGSARLIDLDLLPVRLAEYGRRMGFVTGCRACGLVFSNPQPTAEDRARFYSPQGEWQPSRKDARGHHEEPIAAQFGESWSWPFEPVRAELSVMSPPPGARVLDFGCGTGQMLDAFRAHGWETAGIEPALDDAFRTHRRLMSVPDEPMFDLIVAHHVLEHVSKPLDLLRQFARASRPNGILFIGVPRFDTLPRHRDYKYLLNGHAHITAYTWPCLRTLLARSGWAPVAEPPAEISKGGGGRLTTSRLRVLARRVEGVIPEPASPASAAREALREYYAAGDNRPLAARMGWLRVAARQAEMGRRRAKAARKDASRRAVSDAGVIQR